MPAVDGHVAKGGSIAGTSAPIAHMTQAPGNALLVFEAADRAKAVASRQVGKP